MYHNCKRRRRKEEEGEEEEEEEEEEDCLEPPLPFRLVAKL